MKADAAALPAARSRLGDFLSLTKPRLNSLVVFSTGAGYLLGTGTTPEALPLLHTVVGSTLVAGGAAAFNQVAERDLDQLMERTRNRPMAAGRIQPLEARIFAAGLATLGVLQLALGANVLAAVVALATLLSYVLVYTPLKRRTPWATLVGAVPGALPPVIGWAAARQELGVDAWVLFGIVFLWQLPHFHALAWLYREEFGQAGLPLLAVVEPDGRRNAVHAAAYAALLLAVSLLPTVVGLTGRVYLVSATVLGVAFFLLACRFVAQRTEPRARALFVGSLVYLPLIWGLLVFDRVV